jgi:diguanylate cyclase (GGDEF)-like protein/PAS domain S-box-containing protein
MARTPPHPGEGGRERRFKNKWSAILDALPAHIALLDPDSRIVSVNEAWREFAIRNSLPGSQFGIGQNYIELCQRAEGAGSAGARHAAAGIRSVLDGRSSNFSLEYPCHAPDRERWFRLTVTPLNATWRDGAVVMHINVTERRAAVEKLERNQALLRIASKLSRMGAWQVDLPSLKLTWSREVRAIHGVGESFAPSVEQAMQFYAPEYHGSIQTAVEACMQRGEPFDLELQIITTQNNRLWVRAIGEAERNAGGEIVRVQGAFQDIDQQKRLLARLAESEERFRYVVQATMDVIWDWDLRTDKVWYGSGTQGTYGYAPTDLETGSLTWRNLVHPEDAPGVSETVQRAIDTGSPTWQHHYRIIRKDGTYAHVAAKGAVVRDSDGVAVRIIGATNDVTERRKLEQQLKLSATVDELTGAFNRRSILAQAAVELRRTRRFNHTLAFIFLDIDHFKQVNDRFGHKVGDLVLATFSDICRSALRPSDVFARYGGEEFLVMLPETDLEQANVVARRLATQVRLASFSVDPPLRGLTISAGITAMRGAEDTIEGVLERIDRALYRAKELGRDRVEFAV